MERTHCSGRISSERYELHDGEVASTSVVWLALVAPLLVQGANRGPLVWTPRRGPRTLADVRQCFHSPSGETEENIDGDVSLARLAITVPNLMVGDVD